MMETADLIQWGILSAMIAASWGHQMYVQGRKAERMNALENRMKELKERVDVHSERYDSIMGALDEIRSAIARMEGKAEKT